MSSQQQLLLLPPLLLLLLLGAAPQYVRASPRPDFAIKATISGTARVTSLTTLLSMSFESLTSTDVELEAGYTVLDDMRTALLAIGSSIERDGLAITRALSALASDSSNTIDPPFAAVSGAISTLRQLLQGGLVAQFTVLEQQGDFITEQFADGIESIIGNLAQLSAALGRLKDGVTAARNAPGNTAAGVSAANVRRHVTAKMLTDVQAAVAALNADVPLIQYIIRSTLARLGLADEFLGEIVTEVETNVEAVSSAQQLFEADVSGFADSFSDWFRDTVQPVYQAQLDAIGEVQSTIEGFSSYTDDLLPALTSAAQLLGDDGLTALEGSVREAYDEFSGLISASIAGSASVGTFFAEEACATLQDVIGEFVASGYYADYCFAKFSPRLFTQFASTVNGVLDCYDIETARLFRLQDLLELIVAMIVYDIEDLGEAVTSCAPLTNGAPCLTLIGPFYEELASSIDAKQAYMVSYVEEETKRSLQRLSACVTVSKYAMVGDLETISVQLATCTVDGPQVPGPVTENFN